MICADIRISDHLGPIYYRSNKRPYLFKGGDPAPGSPRATLLRLHPSHESQSGNRPPEG